MRVVVNFWRRKDEMRRALVVKEGETYVLECPQRLSWEQAARIEEVWRRKTGSNVIVLANGTRVARIAEPEDKSDSSVDTDA
jgi:hypothetical protein